MTSTTVPDRASVIAAISRRAADILAHHGYPGRPLTGNIGLGLFPTAYLPALAALASSPTPDGVIKEKGEDGRIDHEFKSHPDVFWPAARGEKTFEFRKDDRGGYHVGQVVRLRCYDHGSYVDVPPLDRRITNILRPGEFGLQEGYCILSLAPLSSTPSSQEIGVGETFDTIRQWCEETFGPATPERIASRAAEEMDELLADPSKVEEAADIVIILSRHPTLWAEIERKMSVNRKRHWRLMGDGTGYHVKEAAPRPSQREG